MDIVLGVLPKSDQGPVVSGGGRVPVVRAGLGKWSNGPHSGPYG